MKLWRAIQEGAGVSRRKAQALVRTGEVELDGRVVLDPYLELAPDTDKLLYLRGQPIPLSPRRPRVYIYHKTRGILCSHDDPHTGDTLGRILRSEGFIGYTWAGRLDRDAEGLVLLSNDGDLISRLTHPRYGVEKVYHVWPAERSPRNEMQRILERMQRGIEDAGESLRILRGSIEGRRVVVVLGQGHKHEIKRLFGRFGLAVARLKRTAIGPVALPPALPPGGIARLGRDEVIRLYTAVGLDAPADL